MKPFLRMNVKVVSLCTRLCVCSDVNSIDWNNFSATKVHKGYEKPDTFTNSDFIMKFKVKILNNKHLRIIYTSQYMKRNFGYFYFGII